MGGIQRPPPDEQIPWETTSIDPPLLDELSTAMCRTGFFGANSYYMNHEANRRYNLEHAVDGGNVQSPVLFVEAKWDAVFVHQRCFESRYRLTVPVASCATSTTRCTDAQRRKCRQLSETSIEAGHWVQLERPRETNAVLARWLVQELQDYWPYHWSNPLVRKT